MVGGEDNGFRRSFEELFKIGFFYMDIIIGSFGLNGEA